MPDINVDKSYTGDARIIYYHKTPTSGRTFFLKKNTGDICFKKLPTLSQIVSPGDKGYVSANIEEHPSMLEKHASEMLNILQEELSIEPGYHEKVDTADKCLSVYLARFNALDLPINIADKHSASFMSMSEARCLSDVEVELLRRAYTTIMED